MLISIILPIHNEANFINNAIDSILRQNHINQEIEILIADGISTDGTRDIIKNKQKDNANIYLIENHEKIVPTGFNSALSISKGEIIIRVDGHTEIAPNYLEKCMKVFMNTEAECVGGATKHIAPGIIGNAVRIAQSSKFGVGGVPFREGVHLGRYVDTLAFGAYKRKVFEKIGGYDEELVRNQDDEFNFRLIQSGGKIWLDPSIKSTYYARTSLLKLFKQYFQYGFYKIRVMQKRKGFASWRHIIPAVFVLSIISGLLLTFFKIRFPLFFLAGSYASFNMGASLFQFLYNIEHLFSILLLPVTYFIMHFAYGIGSLWGLVYFIDKWGDTKIKDYHFNRETFAKAKA